MTVSEILPWVPVALTIGLWIWGGSWAASKIDSKVQDFAKEIADIKEEQKNRQDEFEKAIRKEQEEFKKNMEQMMLPACQKTFKDINEKLTKMDKGVSNLSGKLDGILAVIKGEPLPDPDK